MDRLGGRLAALGVLVACAAHFIVGVDGLAVAIALPALQGDLDAAPIEAQWVLTAYGLAFGGALLLGGRLGDLWGRRRLLVYGMALFAAGSLVAGIAAGLPGVVAGRVLQGFGSAAAMPAGLALIGSLVPAGPARTRALALLAAMTSVGVMSGLLLGGIVTELLGWRWVFLAIAPFAAAAALAARWALPEARAEPPRPRPDVVGAALVTTGLTVALFGVTRLEHGGAGWPLPVMAGLGLLAAFAAWQQRARSPLLPARVLRVPRLRAATLGVGANAVAFTAVVYVGTQYLQRPLGYGPLEAGLALLPVDVVAFVVPLLTADLIARSSPRVTLAGACVVTTLSLAWLARAPVPADYLVDVLLPLAALGASLSIAFVVLTQEAVADVEADDKGVASGIFETANHLFGGAIGVAVYATVLAAAGVSAAFLVAAGLAALGLLAAVATPQRV